MDTEVLKRQFARMGARVKFGTRPRRRGIGGGDFAVDVGTDKQGEFFEIFLGEAGAEDVEVVDVEPRRRHLLLLRRDETSRRTEKHKFLCGHDERAWFVAAVPGASGVSSVGTAIEALKPRAVQNEQTRKRVKPKNRNRRRNAAFVRQGEWFFIPSPDVIIDEKLVLTNEPLVRGRGKPHRAEMLYRSGGETVYVSREHPNGLTEAEYRRLLSRKPAKKRLNWTTMRRNPGVYVKGRIRHSDHKTIVLDCWHLVLPNTESQAPAMRHVAFLD